MGESSQRQNAEPSVFLPTIWTEIFKAADGDRASIGFTYLRYRRPVFLFLEKLLPPVADAELEADKVMETVLSPSFLKRKAHPSKGKFRYLLRAVTRNHARNVRRQLRRYQTIDPDTIILPAREENQIFDSVYAGVIMEQARERLRTDCVARGSQEAEVLHLAYDLGMSQAEVAQLLGRTAAWVNNLMHRGRARLRRHFEAALKRYCCSDAELASETAYLWRLALGPKHPPSSPGRQ